MSESDEIPPSSLTLSLASCLSTISFLFFASVAALSRLLSEFRFLSSSFCAAFCFLMLLRFKRYFCETFSLNSVTSLIFSYRRDIFHSAAPSSSAIMMCILVLTAVNDFIRLFFFDLTVFIHAGLCRYSSMSVIPIWCNWSPVRIASPCRPSLSTTAIHLFSNCIGRTLTGTCLPTRAVKVVNFVSAGAARLGGSWGAFCFPFWRSVRFWFLFFILPSLIPQLWSRLQLRWIRFPHLQVCIFAERGYPGQLPPPWRASQYVLTTGGPGFFASPILSPVFQSWPSFLSFSVFSFFLLNAFFL